MAANIEQNMFSGHKGSTGQLPVAAVVPMTSDNETAIALSSSSAETVPKVIARNIPTRTVEPFVFDSAQTNVRFSLDYENTDSISSDTLCKSIPQDQASARPDMSPRQLPKQDEARQQHITTHNYSAGRLKLTPEPGPVFTVDDIKSDYVKTTCTGLDGDERIPGYHGEATSNAVVSLHRYTIVTLNKL
jgi:hypothetical protein